MESPLTVDAAENLLPQQLETQELCNCWVRRRGWGRVNM